MAEQDPEDRLIRIREIIDRLEVIGVPAKTIRELNDWLEEERQKTLPSSKR